MRLARSFSNLCDDKYQEGHVRVMAEGVGADGSGLAKRQ